MKSIKEQTDKLNSLMDEMDNIEFPQATDEEKKVIVEIKSKVREYQKNKDVKGMVKYLNHMKKNELERLKK